MKIRIDRAPLMKALAHVQSVVEKRNTIPILANVLLSAKAGVLTLTATNMEIAVVETVTAETLRDGTCTAPAATLFDIIKRLPDGASVEMGCDDGSETVKLRAGKYNTSLTSLPIADFPSMTAGKLPHRFTLPAAAMRALIDRAKFAVSTEETRYYLNGIYFHSSDADGTPVLRAVATDGHRLARVDEPLPDGAAGIAGTIVPRFTITELRKLIDDAPGDIAVGLSDTRIQVTVGTVMLTSKLIDGTFPEYDRVIPKDNDRKLTVNKRALASAISRVSAVSSEKARPIKMVIAEGSLSLHARDDKGTATEELDGDAVSYSGPAMEVGFQARYLSDILDQVGSDVAFDFSTTDAPAVVRDPADASAMFVLMPMRV